MVYTEDRKSLSVAFVLCCFCSEFNSILRREHCSFFPLTDFNEGEDVEGVTTDVRGVVAWLLLSEFDLFTLGEYLVAFSVDWGILLASSVFKSDFALAKLLGM